MKKNIKNKDLEKLILGADHLANYAMPGSLTLAIVQARNDIKVALERYRLACEGIGEKYCLKDEKGLSVSEFQKDAKGKEMHHLPKRITFKDTESENKAQSELIQLGETETEIELKEFDNNLIENLKDITPVQMEMICYLIRIIKN